MSPEELKRLRKAAGLSQGELADALGMNRVTVSAMERGANPIEKRTDLAVRYLAARLRVLERLTKEAEEAAPGKTWTPLRAASIISFLGDLSIEDAMYRMAKNMAELEARADRER